MNLSIVVCALLGLALGIVLFWLKKESRHRIKNTWILIITIVLSLCGFALAIAEEYLSQYDYDPSTIIKYEGYRKHGVSFDTLRKGDATTSPEFIFVLDVSGSTKKMPSVELTSSVNDQIAAIKKSGLLDATLNFDNLLGIDNKKNTIPFCNLLKVRLLYSLSVLRAMNYDTINYRIIYFGENCEEPPIPYNKGLVERIKESYNDIIKKKLDSKNTNFVALLDYINELIRKFDNPQKDIVVVFLTDYIHDVKNDTPFDTQKALEQSIKGIEDTGANLKLCMITDEDSSIISDGRIDKLLQDNLSPHIFNKLDLRGAENVFNYPMMMPAPFPFFYSNSKFENSLRTSMAFSFNQKKTIGFRLGNYINNKRLECKMYVGDDEYLLSRNIHKVEIKKGERVYFEIKGYISAPYTFPDIIFEDESVGAQYFFPVVFIRESPRSVYLLLSLVFGLVLSSTIISIRLRAKHKNIEKRKVEDNIKETSCKKYDLDLSFVKE